MPGYRPRPPKKAGQRQGFIGRIFTRVGRAFTKPFEWDFATSKGSLRDIEKEIKRLKKKPHWDRKDSRRYEEMREKEKHIREMMSRW